ncbi:hypothetical protein MPC4_90101 [Methylocella tundrae]|uniref:Uncharacterized protein n=1 Tax=Methylocella tundrae TaxID=227605 RepID=A0A8B6MDF1_METTU|nr:hypothetical protein [Methylocella tundrae]VTZ25762.1 hypothetical protein MPC1_2550005 [Methylocella tundrae]VTZ52626.1 hypothetical protein MPC4_90101 [Methylocella tundrae]
MARATIQTALQEDVKKALEENLNLLDPEKHKTARNMTVALIQLLYFQGEILKAQTKIRDDVALLHNKLQPILKYLEEDNSDWRSRNPNYEGG